MLYNKPSQAQTWGTIVLVFAVVSLLSAGGFIIGALLGIVGGLLALTWRRPT
jgi:preprotein translocase subunit SecE